MHLHLFIFTTVKDKPVTPIVLEKVVVFVDPFVEAEEELVKMREEEEQKIRDENAPKKEC